MRPSSDVAYVALGSNLGDRAAFLERARGAIAELPGTRILAASTVEETAPIGPAGQGPYLNQMLAVETSLAPETLLAHLQEIECAAGRERGERWGARTIDLDIVLLERQRVATARLTVPHPELPRRDFWQRELAELRTLLGPPPAASTGDDVGRDAGAAPPIRGGRG
jgi:2-amino-4-hydroxy-6-hydroxymethyldihydropteridine diphosphokinase